MTIDTGENFLGLIASSSSQVMDGLGGVVSLIVGVLLAFLIVEMVIGLLQNRNNDTINQ